MYEHRGKVTVVNFWATWCTPCVQELPYFNELSVEHPEINVIAIHSANITSDVMGYINKNWPDYSVAFAQDEGDIARSVVYQLLGGKGTWPMTVIIDEQGKVLYNSSQSFHNYEQLEQLVTSLIAAQE